MKRNTSIKILLVIFTIVGIHKFAWSSTMPQSQPQLSSLYWQQFARSQALSIFYRSFQILSHDPAIRKLPVCQNALKTFTDLKNNFANNGGMIILTQLVNDPIFKQLVAEKNPGCVYIQEEATKITKMFFDFQKNKPDQKAVDEAELILYRALKAASLTQALVTQAARNPQSAVALALNAFLKVQQTFFMEGGRALSAVVSDPDFKRTAQNTIALQAVLADFMFAEEIYKFAQAQARRK